MLSNIQKNIIIRAARIRMEKGEELKTILASYTKLTDEERKNLSGIISDMMKPITQVAETAESDRHQELVEGIRARVTAGENLKDIIGALDLTDEGKWQLEKEVKEGL